VFDVLAIQNRLTDVDGWLFFDHHHRDPIAYRVLDLDSDATVTRRWFYWIPATGTPRKVVHRIESWVLAALPGETMEYATWQELHAALRESLKGTATAAMQYSPDCAIPTLSNVDAGTIDLIRGLGVDIVSSAALVQEFEAVWSETEYALHIEAGTRVDRIRGEAFESIAQAHRGGETSDEHSIAEFIRRRFGEEGLVTDHGPIVAVNAHSGDPHYEPMATRSAAIRPGDFVLIDLWAKRDVPGGVYYDVTWTGYCGDTVPAAQERIFNVVAAARDAALALVDERIRAGTRVAGWEVDAAARSVIDRAGYGDAFTHRLGHSIGADVHGNGVNLDNFETRDTRPIVPGVCFSIEPGIYLPEFGVRSEIDCFVHNDGARATGPVQTGIVRIV